MITVIGDVHAKFGRLHNILEHIPSHHTVIQVGDFGIWPHYREVLENGFSRPLYFIDGNHEYFPHLTELSAITELYPNLFYVPRGTYIELDGRKVLFLGGAESIDKEYRREYIDWFREESISYADTAKIDFSWEVDLMITHTPPYRTIYEIRGSDTPREWNHSSVAVEAVWTNVGQPPLVCGHLHQTRTIGNVTVLNELDTLEV